MAYLAHFASEGCNFYNVIETMRQIQKGNIIEVLSI